MNENLQGQAEFFQVPGRQLRVRLSEISFYDMIRMQAQAPEGQIPQHLWYVILGMRGSPNPLQVAFQVELEARNCLALLNKAMGLSSSTVIEPEPPRIVQLKDLE